MKSNTWNWICPKFYRNGKLLTFHADHDDFFKFLSIWPLQTFISPSVLIGYIFEWQDDPAIIQAWSVIRFIMVIISNTFIIDSFCLFTATNLISLEFSLTQRTAAYVGIILVLQWANWWLYFTFELIYKKMSVELEAIATILLHGFEGKNLKQYRSNNITRNWYKILYIH